MDKKNTTDKKSFWLKLDNAAKIFPGQNSRSWSNSFRVCYELTQPVEPDILLRALKDIMPRFPCYDVRIRHGFFWFYLESNPKDPIVLEDVKNPCYRVNYKENNNFLFKVYYYANRVAVDVYHVLTDGKGGAIFLSTLVAQYFRLKGCSVPAGGYVLDINSPVSDEELEDSFVKYSDSKAKYKRFESIVYHANGQKMPTHMVNITSGILSFRELHAVTKMLDVTITEYLAAVMLKVLIEKQNTELGDRKKRNVSIQIPVDLRRTFASNTLRNFTICLSVKVDPMKGEYSFEELLTQAKYQLRLVNSKNELNMIITANMGLERNPFIRLAPLFLKNAVIGVSFFFTAEQTTSSLITNLGAVSLPKELEEHISKLIFMPAPGKLNAARVGVATYNDSLSITFSNSFRESDIERSFFTELVKRGFHVKIESNRE